MMGVHLIMVILFMILFPISNQLEIGVMREIRGVQNEFLLSEGGINSISKFSVVAEDQLKSFGNLDSDFALKHVTEIGNEISNRLKELMGLNLEVTSTSNRGAFVLYDTNDYPFACICDSQKYAEWKEGGSNPSIRVECTNKINTSIFNGADVDYCDPTNIAAGQTMR
ncbi:hypothetical protein FG379_002062 [Cryptosporidium bovis]|uniref:uncharacterized protein n=1 Tax=Cryptosporidium bovis TaxID=310047 RepID=UPI003519EAA2|nr:hypothetical protein FG379_002062 [Cryptosporidium bovis]